MLERPFVKFGEYIRALREESGPKSLTLKEVAEHLGMSIHSLMSVEHGITLLRPCYHKKFCELFQLKPSAFRNKWAKEFCERDCYMQQTKKQKKSWLKYYPSMIK